VKSPTLIDMLHHPKVWGTPAWRPDQSTWKNWDAFHKTVAGLPLDDSELRVFRKCTGRTAPRPGGYTTVIGVMGRRSGKTLSMAQQAVYQATMRTWPGAPGERRVVLVVASTAKQGRAVFSYCRSLLTEAAPLKKLLIRETASELDLDSGITIEIVVNDYRSIRGSTIICAILDELAFWDVEGSNPDTEVITAVKAGMASCPGAMLFMISSPYAKRGALWEGHRKHYGMETSRTLVWQAASRTMNPSLSVAMIDEAIEADPFSARSEFLGEFRDDIAGFIDREVVEAAVIRGRHEVAPGELGLINLSAMFDFAGGSGRDSSAMAISGQNPATLKGVLMCVREIKPPFSPENVCAEFAEILRSYGIFEAVSDKFAGSFPAEQMAKLGITLTAAKPSSEIFIDFLPLLMSKRVELLDDKTVVNQICGLERNTGRGRDYISAGGNGHDDVAVVVAGSLRGACRPEFEVPIVQIFVADKPLHDRWSPNWGGGYAGIGGVSVGPGDSDGFVGWAGGARGGY